MTYSKAHIQGLGLNKSGHQRHVCHMNLRTASLNLRGKKDLIWHGVSFMRNEKLSEHRPIKLCARIGVVNKTRIN